MEKIKIIELLQRVSNGTQPNEIFYNKSTYRWIEENNNYYRTASGSDYISFEYDNYIIDNINDYVEIVEEDKKEDDFSGIKFYQNGKVDCWIDTSKKFEDLHIKKDKKIEKINISKYIGTDISIDDIMINKINEIIDYINKENK